jgi:PAS domain S-box-containing protein
MTLRTKTVLLVSIIVSAALGVTGFLYLRFLEDSLNHSISTGLESISITTSESISKYLNDTSRDVRAIAQNLPLDALERRDAPAIEKHLETVSRIYTEFENGIFLLDEGGRLWADYPVHEEVRDRSFDSREYFQRTMSEERGIVGIPYHSARTGQPVLTFTALLRGSEGRVLGLLGCSVQLLSPKALGGIRNTRIGRSGYIFVYDKSRLMILHPDDERVLKRDVPPGANPMFDRALEGFEGVGETVNSRGIRMISAFKHVPGTDWIIASQQPESEAHASIREARRLILLGMCLAVLASFLVGTLVARGITRPLAELREAALQFCRNAVEGRGDLLQEEEAFRKRLSEIKSRDEIGELAVAFRNLSQRLGDSIEELRKSSSDWERTFDSVTDAIFILDGENRIVRINRAAATLMNADSSVVGGRYCFELMHGTEKPPDFCPHLKTLASGKVSRVEVSEPFLGKFIEVTTTPLFDDAGKTVGSVHVTRDISESKAAEEKLRQSRERYRNIFETATVSIWEEDLSQVKAAIENLKAAGVEDFRAYFEAHPDFVLEATGAIQVRDVNEETVKLYGARGKEELLGPLGKIFAPESLPVFRGLLLAIAEGKSYFESEAVNRTLGGEKLDIFMTVRIPSRVEEFKNILVSMIDISGRKRTERALAESEETARALLNAPTDSAVLLDARGTILALNETAAARIGRTIDELIGKCIYDFFTPGLVQSRKESVEEVFGTGKPSRFEVESRGRVFGGIVYPVYDSQGKVARVAVFASDITERQELEQERVRASKLEAMGILAGGIAHDFNNILTAILGNINLARWMLAPENKAHARIEEAEKASLRAKDLAQQLLTFSKGGVPIKKLTSVQGLVRESASFALSGSSVKSEFHLPDDLPYVEIDEGQINQVINNLVINAVQAMPEGGIVTIRADNAVLAEDNELGLAPGSYVRISVEDKGVGIKKEHLAKVFDPYFTTKQKGSGFGLATVHSIVKRHGGNIGVKSELGIGTVFSVLLPASAAEAAEKISEERKPLAGKGRILLMDDEEMVREIAGEMLVFLGYEVEFAENGDQALKLYSAAMETGAPFDAVIMDLTIPGGMGGREAIVRLREIDPRVKAIVSSGYSNDPIMGHYEEFGFVGVFTKPYRLDDMSQALHKVISGERAEA